MHKISGSSLLSEAQARFSHLERELRAHQRLLQQLLALQKIFSLACVVGELLLELRLPELDVAEPLREFMLDVLLRAGRGGVRLLTETVAFCPQPLRGRSLLLSSGVVESVRVVPLRRKVFRRGSDKFCHSPANEKEELKLLIYELESCPAGRAHQRKLVASIR